MDGLVHGKSMGNPWMWMIWMIGYPHDFGKPWKTPI
jgi:hypothetical protein